MSTIWQALIKCILHIFIEKSHPKFPFHPLKYDSGIEGRRVVPTTLLLATKKLGNLDWRQCLLMEKNGSSK